ncbi:hypothetical protein DM02DRAFT_636147 [Periconia macrospinosa]|uniref:BHLH domain-containing protein n=1 Tax=Periconia macrospinosa TaxID=97972 RepID=A0A2V1D189_9PLEO|nr:hypothetical protein DM02DRAFT_636147 [Periconia macrospinosa]
MDFLDLTLYSPTSETLSSSPTALNFWSLSQSPIHSDSANSTGTLSSTAMTDPNAWPNLRPEPFGEMCNLNTAFTIPEAVEMSTSPCLSSQTLRSRSPSTCPSDRQSEAESKPPPWKRDRPRLYRQTTGSSESASEKAAYPQRSPHTQVERKYRERLNMELDRLRRAVPTLPQGNC